jgi:hypothetical protein
VPQIKENRGTEIAHVHILPYKLNPNEKEKKNT